MNISDVPKKQPVPFGINGQREDLLSTTPAGDNQASYDAGFPPITMILKSAGGLPPKGQDMNQILYELAAIARWAGAGANYPFDSTFATAIGGYPAGAKVLASDNAGFWLNGTDENSTNPEAADYTLTGWVPSGHTGTTAIAGLDASDVTLSSLQAAKDVITLAGTLTANINLILPAWKKQWKVINNCTGAFTVTVKTNSGTGQAIPSGQEANIRGDGTNIYYAELNTASLFSEIATLGSTAIATARTNLGLGDIALAGVASGVLGTAGYITLPMIISGEKQNLIIQWGNGTTVSGGSSVAITFPISFPNAVYSITISDTGSSAKSYGASITTTGATVYTSSSNGTSAFRYISIGH